ncbi:MAG: inositol monophosphatase [Rhodospirillaceae bacterium]|jgi:myo-inositol-1(or 4)-monophosphatase|nr:inositol monophosphatase [Rhodospirillaceae bacterium]MBT5812517.1 inositol monophosphatase [Rhodospirillaceae bacterium]
MALRSPTVNVMAMAAEKAARALVRDFGEVEQLQVSRKGPADFVSTADMKAEKTLVRELQKARPNFGFLLEEQGEIAGVDPMNRWIIDPLDGTTNFLHGLPHFAISIALEYNKEIIAGVIYDPIRDEMFWSERGQGAYLNDKRLRVSGHDKLDDSLFATGIPFKGVLEDGGHQLFVRQLEQIMAVSSGVRRWGSAALDLAYIAAGRYDGYWENGLNPWDVAAGILMVREAGGLVTDIAGRRYELGAANICASNDGVHQQFRNLLRDAEA